MSDEQMDKWYKVRIKAEADVIKDELRSLTLYGMPIDETDPDMLIVAAYYAGMRPLCTNVLSAIANKAEQRDER